MYIRGDDMDILDHPQVTFEYAGLFQSRGRWIHPDRTEKTHELLCVTGSEVYLNDDGKEFGLTKGQCLLLKAGTRHYGTKESEKVSFYWLHFRTENMLLPFFPQSPVAFDNSHLFKELLHYAFLPSPPQALVNAMLVRILAEIRYLQQTPRENSGKTAEEICEWIRANASAALTAEETARRFGFSCDHISRLLKKQYGVSTKVLIDRFLLCRIKDQLCNTGKYIKEIAYELDFNSDKAMIGFFKYHEGLFPSEFRNRFYKIHMNNH